MANANQGRGQFEFAAVPFGTWALNISAQGHSHFSREVEVTKGSNVVELVELEPETDNAAVVLRGRVLLQGDGDASGNSGGIQVKATAEGNLVNTSQTALDGTFAFLASRQNHDLSFVKEGFT